MKILKNKTYNGLIEKINILEKEKYALKAQMDVLNDQSQKYLSLLTEANNRKIESLRKISVRRFVVGKKGSGKTTYIQSLLKGINYCCILDSRCEYSSRDSRVVDISKLSHLEIISIIGTNQDKIIVIDDFNYLFNSLDDIQQFLLNPNFNFIISVQSKKQIEKFIEFCDCVIDLGAIDDFSDGVDTSKVVRFPRLELKKLKESPTCHSLLNLVGASLLFFAGLKIISKL